MKIYVASSWKTRDHNFVVYELERAGHEVYDYREPESAGIEGVHGAPFTWDISGFTRIEGSITAQLNDEAALQSFRNDRKGMEWADACVLVLPATASPCLSAGWFAGQGKPVHVFAQNGEPALMYLLAKGISGSIEVLLLKLQKTEEELGLKKASHPGGTPIKNLGL